MCVPYLYGGNDIMDEEVSASIDIAKREDSRTT